ncbi:MAG: nucleotidyltransferase domain-containing protein [Candidatus Parcubacteria bacterium]|nr:nucleotidyltransferase domain-containing protein [Candidatus Parcubacteria bacterium]
MKEETPIILFGSRAREESRDDSDTDIGVFSEQDLTSSEKMTIYEKVSHELNISEDKIDLVELRHASPLLQYRVAREGRLLFGNHEKFIRFQVLAWKRYLSTAKFRRMREQSLLKKYA